VTRIIVKFEGFAGRYVYHCHMLEHEDNEMMRPYLVLPANPQTAVRLIFRASVGEVQEG